MSSESTVRGLRSSDFVQIGKNGFGDGANAYCHCMCYFNGQLYTGTTRNSMALLKLFPPIDPPALDPWPVDVPARVQDLDMQGQIWRWKGRPGEWEMVYRSPMIPGKQGEPAPRDLGYRGMVVYQSRTDPTPALYVGSMSTVLRGTAAHILKTYDGEFFEVVGEPGLGNPNISTFRSLIAFDGHLYVPPAGEGVNFNSNRKSIIMRSDNPAVGNWQQACEPGFGDSTNNGIFMTAKFNNHLYAGTFNHYQGYQVWKTPANGGGPCQWSKVIERGAHRGPLSQIAMAMCEHDGALYVGSSIQNGGYDRYNLVGPASGEIIRIYPDDSWELLVGSPRHTPQGFKYPLSGLGPGFDNLFAGYTWRMVTHEGWLYVTTFDWSVYMEYANRPSPTARRLIEELGRDRLIEVGGGFEMWRTRDGINWYPVTTTGFDNPFNYGGRTLVSSPEGLFVGTANPFGPKAPAKLGPFYEYIDNPYGGTEVWLGRRDQEGFTEQDAQPGQQRVSVISGRKKQRVLVTGAAGYIGNRVVERLLDRGYRVRALVQPGTAGLLANPRSVEVVEGDLDDPVSLSGAVQDVDLVCHLAAVLGGSAHKSVLRRINVDGTAHLLKACGGNKTLRRFFFSSSVAVYSGQYEPEEWPLTESSALRTDGGSDLTDYGLSKVAGENLVRFYARKFGFGYSMVRISLVYGVGNKDTNQLIEEALSNPRFGTGPAASFPRQYIHVDDAAEGIVRATVYDSAESGVFNVAGSDPMSNADIARVIRRFSGTASEADLIPDRTRGWRRYVMPYDVMRAKRILGFKAAISMSEGLEEVLRNKLAVLPATPVPRAGEVS